MTRAAAKRSKDGPHARRLLALAAIYDAATRTEAAQIGGVTVQVVRDWVITLGPVGLIDRKAPGQRPRLNDGHRATLTEINESGPTPADRLPTISELPRPISSAQSAPRRAKARHWSCQPVTPRR